MQWNQSLRVAAVAGALALVQSAFAQSSDYIESRHLREADGTSGQDTNAGSGVKTGHLQDAAVTSAKLADGAVTGAKIAPGAVGDAQIAGPISSSKVGGLDAALAGKAAAGHDHDAVYRRKHAKVVIVATDGSGDFTDPAAAAAAVTDASEANPYVVKVLPGVYTVTSPVGLKPFVDLEGSGRGVTRILMTGTGWEGTVSAAPDSEIRDVTVEASEGLCAVGRPSTSSAGPVRLTRMAAVATRVTDFGGYWGALCASSASYVLESVQLSGSGPFVFTLFADRAGTIAIRNSEVFASAPSHMASAMWIMYPGTIEIADSRVVAQASDTRGIVLTGGDRSRLRVRDTVINAQNYGLLLENSDAVVEGSTIDAPSLAVHAALGSDVRVAGSKVNGPVYIPYWSPATVRCFGTYTPDLTAYSCP